MKRKRKKRRTPEELAAWHESVRLRAAEAEAKRAARKAARKRRAEEAAAKRAAREEYVRKIREKYGFTIGKKPTTPAEEEGRRLYCRDKDREKRVKDADRIRSYFREYRRRRAAEALARKQEKWEAADWAAWEKRMEAKENPKGSPQWLFREAVKLLARRQGLHEDVVTERLIELGGMDFLLKGAESMGRDACSGSGMVRAAVNALLFHLDPENAAMFTT